MTRFAQRLAIVFASLLTAAPAMAESGEVNPIAKGRHWVGFTLGARSQHLEHTTALLQDVIDGQTTTGSIAAAYGWFPQDATSIGVGFAYGREHSDVTSDQSLGPDKRLDRAVNTATMALVSRSYLPLGNPHFYMFNQTGVSAGFTWGSEVTTVTQSVESDISGSRYALDLQPGIAVLVARGFAVEASVNVLGLSWETERTKTPGLPDAVRTTTSLDFEINLLRLGIGLTYYF